MVNDVNKFIMPNGDEIKIDGLYGKITNCLLEVPQRIKLELNNGVLTLKAGSQVIIPNGFETDGTTPKFDEVVVENDLTMTNTWVTAEKVAIFVSPNATSLNMVGLARISSGTTAPTTTDTRYWYDTNTNLVKIYGGGSYTGNNLSFPIAICTKTSASTDNLLASIDQVFNGMGYIGSTVWVDKGVKGLIPNGRNADGTLKNTEYKTTKVETHTEPVISSVKFRYILLNTQRVRGTNVNTFYIQEVPPTTSASGAGWFNPVENTFKYYDAEINDWVLDDVVLIGSFVNTQGVISNFRPKTTFHALDYNDFSNTPHLIDTYVNGISGYRIWSDGYCEQWGRTGNKTNIVITLTKKMSDTNYNIQITVLNSNGDQNWAATNITVNGFTILDSENKEHSWKVSGYLAEGEY